MDDNTHYYKDPPKLIFELLEDTFGDRFQYFLGSPINIDVNAYPCIIVQPVSGNNSVTDAPTGTDNVAEIINVHVCMLDSGNAATSGTTDTVMRNLYNTIQGRDPATGFYMSGTLLYALRTNIDLGTAIIDHDIDVNYDATPVADHNVMEAIVSIATRERVAVPNRV